jgi:Ser/Thr protein kinase RdoA (MazF antagonist)
VQGQHYALKETVAPLEEEQAQLAHAFQHTAAKAGVRSPEPILTRDGAVLVRVGAATLRLYRWVEMSGPDRMISAEEVGRCLARLHRSAPPIEARTHPWYSEPVGRDRWEKLTRLLGQQRAPFVDRLAALVDELVAVESVYVEPVDRMLCHRDLFADNVRVVPDGGLVVIDWDNCGAASADQELGMVLLEFGVDEDRVTRLYDSYCAAGGPGRVTVVSDLTMAAATVGHIGELACRQWLEATDEAARSRAVARVEEFLTEPWTLDVLERVVGVVREASRGRDG